MLISLFAQITPFGFEEGGDNSWKLYPTTTTAVTDSRDFAEGEQQSLLHQIAHAHRLADPAFKGADAIVGTIYPEKGINFPWRRKQVRLWPLDWLGQPLWRGDDCEIYRAYTESGRSNAACFRNGISKAHHWKRARLENRRRQGLLNILNGFKNLIDD